MVYKVERNIVRIQTFAFQDSIVMYLIDNFRMLLKRFQLLLENDRYYIFPVKLMKKLTMKGLLQKSYHY